MSDFQVPAFRVSARRKFDRGEKAAGCNRLFARSTKKSAFIATMNSS